MKAITSVAAIAAALLVPAAPALAADCAVYGPNVIVAGQTFDIRVSRVPGYPGSWFSPTIRLEINYPTNAGWSYKQIDTRTI